MKKQPSKIISVQLPIEACEQIEKLAQKNYTTVSTVFRQIIMEYFKEHQND